ncbi:MAG TPA: family 1 glycosylhydrolase [Polyangiaceae bacterium]|nr:family 1 glycosylhydrolase [Polyangiaceae bacterium]
MSEIKDKVPAGASSERLEMWGGIECTVNRVGEDYFDQLERNGHAYRPGDIQAIATLGIRAIRYPVLWERTAPDEDGPASWTWSDERLASLRDNRLRPIVGLTHHGSGPRHTSLVSACFPEKLSRYARAVAERYPWVKDFTPVNEPMTTARFSGLYGHWYPHGKDDATFTRALVTQCRGIVCAMQAIRQVTPNARLVQTEDLGRVYSTPALSEVAEFCNERRWLSLDLLCGRVNRDHSLWSYLLSSGVTEEELAWFQENACPPDVVGINHYLTSDRFIDERLSVYPQRPHEPIPSKFADVEAVRARLDLPVGPCTVLSEAWARYGLPVAVTEAHLGGTREEQLRWLYEVWTGAERLRRSNVDVRAVTVWSLFGAYDWNVLVTRSTGFYEPGVFDVRAPSPRRTALARLVRELATNEKLEDEPLVTQPGWWRRPDRLFHPAAHGRSVPATQTEPTMDMENRSRQPLLIVGPSGTLGRAFLRLCDARGIAYHVAAREQLDLSRPFSAEELLLETNAWAVVNAAGYVRVDQAEREEELAMTVNASGPAALAQGCARLGLPLLTFSSDLVFSGRQIGAPYTESSAVEPLNAYGRSKAAMEERVLAHNPLSLVIRTSSFFGPWDEANFVTQSLRALATGDEVIAAGDVVMSPTYVPDLVHAALDLLVDGARGLWHLANQGEVTWYELACRAAEMAGLPTAAVRARPAGELGLAAQRPLYSALRSERGWVMPSLDSGLRKYLTEVQFPASRPAERLAG